MSNGRKTPRKHARRQRGAALILTVIVIMVLTTLGMAMVTFTVVEERSASSYRDTMQVRATAEAGVRVVQEMFRTPTDRNLVPLYSATATTDPAVPSSGSAYDYYGSNDTEIDAALARLGIFRTARTGFVPPRYAGPSNKFFSGPFGQTWDVTFGGTYSPTPANDKYDLKFNCTNPNTNAAVPDCWLDRNINAMFQTSTDWNLQAGRITDISFYAPPSAGGNIYGIATVRVTAVKTAANGTILARETLEAVIADNNLTPSVLGNGDVEMGSPSNFNGCGNGCEQIHANGNLNVTGTITGGDPSLTATGTVNGTAHNAATVTPPEINPWDLVYRPSGAQLGNYYLVTARQLDTVWTNGVASDNPAPTVCGMSTCQDYNLEYDNASPRQPKTMRRSSAGGGRAYLYSWDAAGQGWTQRAGPVTSGNLSWTGANGTLSFNVTLADDTVIGTVSDISGSIPFNKSRVPATVFDVTSTPANAIILVDGKLNKHGAFNSTVTFIAVGSIEMQSNTSLQPAAANGALLISGRDIHIDSSFNNTLHNSCNGSTPSTAVAAYSGIIATHEQFASTAQTSLAGLVIAESAARHDSTVSNVAAIDMRSGDHAYLCGQPEYPWSRPTKPFVMSIRTAVN